ncbi:hypothetical protein, partial [Mesorhizobium sp. M2D.F.Ca.ET.171.01.1.1]|uniref:hypothetical protein n=1 Tax=Mesorhizobium sp. M2D.F.Ca.ET.171.01.1.1 TaxID=2563936 RepID=UPI001AED74E4
SITPDGEAEYRDRGGEHRLAATWVLANVAPYVLDRVVTARVEPVETSPEKPEGAQVKVNLLLSRLPRLLDETVAPEAAFGGTFHINETWSQLQ